jgi:hypothetical protein
LRLLSNKTAAGSLTSPAKAGGVNKVEFLYRSQRASADYLIQTSKDGLEWETKETLTGEGNGINKHYEKVIADKEAKYFRIQAQKATDSYYDPMLFLDSVVIDALPYLRQVGSTNDLKQATRTIPVSVAGFLSSNASIALASASDFSIEKTELTPAEISEGKTATLDLTLTKTVSGEYKDTILISNTDLGVEPLEIPVSVIYTHPVIELSEAVEAVITITVPVVIPAKVKGVLNSNASITLAEPEANATLPVHSFQLSQATITPAEVANEAIVSLEVTFTAAESGVYPATLSIENAEIETLDVPLSVTYNGTGINSLLQKKVDVYVSKGILHVTDTPLGTRVTVLNVSGQSVFTSIVNSTAERYNVDLATGVYVVKVGEKTWKVVK